MKLAKTALGYYHLRYIFILFLIGQLFGSCKSFDYSKVAVENHPLSPKLPSLEKKIESFNNTVVVSTSEELKLYSEEVEKNLTDPYGNKVGFIGISERITNEGTGIGLVVIQSFMADIPCLFGSPLMRLKKEIELEIRIYTNENRLIGKYSATGKARAFVALYWGYSVKDAQRKVTTEAINAALNKIRPQIQEDVNRLAKELNK